MKSEPRKNRYACANAGDLLWKGTRDYQEKMATTLLLAVIRQEDYVSQLTSRDVRCCMASRKK